MQNAPRVTRKGGGMRQTLTRNELTHLVNVFFCTASCWSATKHQTFYTDKRCSVK